MTLFVYGIFLSAGNRREYGMVNPSYAVVPDYVTTRVGESIVEAQKVEGYNLALTGLLVDMPIENLPALDTLEMGYQRILIKTISGRSASMYVKG